MQQAARVSGRVAYFHLGRLVEVDETDDVLNFRPISEGIPAEEISKVDA